METFQTKSNFSESIYIHNFSRRLMFRELEFSDQLRFMWGWCWRGFCITVPATLGAMMVGCILGGMFGLVMAILHKDIHGAKLTLQFLGGTVGVVAGFAGLFPLISWLTNANIGKYELWIVKTREE
jgi:ABC-type amino acid transport system permease subunit